MTNRRLASSRERPRALSHAGAPHRGARAAPGQRTAHRAARRRTLLQIQPTAAVAPSADLVAWSRLGSSYSPAELDRALENGTLIELRAMIRPGEDLALYRADMAEWPGRGVLPEWREANRDWVQANDDCRLDILDRLETSGPLPSRELPDTCLVPWTSSGWNNDRNVPQMLELLVLRGEVAVTGRRSRDRLWDVASRVYPDDQVVPAEEALRIRNERRLRALGIARARGPECPVEPLDVGEAGEAAVIEGVRGTWRVDPAQVGRSFSGRAALLSPFDRLIHDRQRMLELFEFDYQLEMYKPAAKRRWGYFALPILASSMSWSAAMPSSSTPSPSTPAPTNGAPSSPPATSTGSRTTKRRPLSPTPSRSPRTEAHGAPRGRRTVARCGH